MKLLDDLKKPVPEHLPEGKSRMTYAMLAHFFGHYGLHNYWAGGAFAEKGKAQLIMGLLVGCCCPCFLGIPTVLSWISAIRDTATVK